MVASFPCFQGVHRGFYGHRPGLGRPVAMVASLHHLGCSPYFSTIKKALQGPPVQSPQRLEPQFPQCALHKLKRNQKMLFFNWQIFLEREHHKKRKSFCGAIERPSINFDDIIDVVRILWGQQSIIWWYWVSGPSHLFILYFLFSTFPPNHHSCDKESTVWLSVNLQCSSAARLREVPETQAFSQPHKWSSSNF